jgi:uncharacterized protein
MLIDISEMQHGDKKELLFVESLPSPLDESVTIDVSFSGALARDGEKLVLSGEAKARLDAVCDFCLKPFVLELEFFLEEVFLEEVFLEEAFSGIEYEDIWVFSGNAIDTSEALRVNLLGSAPLAFLCKPDCKGLCPRCGQDLNLADCGCQKKFPDPRLGALNDLFR